MTRPEPPSIPLQGDELTMLADFLDFYRAELLDRAHGLSDEQLRVLHPPSTLSLARLLGHMAMVEQTWFLNRFDGEDMAEPWASLDWDVDVDAEMTLAETWSGPELRHRYQASIDDSRTRFAAAQSLDQLSVLPNGEGERWNLRWIMIHMIEEYARHCGHADFIRESIDGDLAH